MTAEIIGRACIAPGARCPQQLFELLREGKCTVSEIPDDRWDKARFWHPVAGTRGKTYSFAAGVLDNPYEFDFSLFGLSKREAQTLDPQQRVILQLTWRALEDANLSPAALSGRKVGVYVGASSLDHGSLIVDDPASANPYFMTGNTLSVVSNRISHVFGLNGPSMTVDTACSSGLVALDLAMRALRSGDIDTAIVGGINLLSHPLPFVGFAQARMLSPAGLCRAYDNDGMGYVRSEGGVVFILRRSDVAAAENDRSHARIVASGVNADGSTHGIAFPSREAQAALLQAIYADAAIDVDRLAFIEGHGTGTKVGDPAEVWSIGTVIGRNRRAPIPIGSIKSNIGHMEPASGLIGLMKATLALEHDYLPASLHFDTPNEHIDFNVLNVRVVREPIDLLPSAQPRLAGVNSFGFGGANAHIVISDPQNPTPMERQADTGRPLLISAHTAASLERLLASCHSEIADAPQEHQQELIAAIGVNRPHLRHRFVVDNQSPANVLSAIESRLGEAAIGDFEAAVAEKNQAGIAFVFSGNGSQWPGMSVDAFNNNADFRESFLVVSALFKLHSGLDLSELLTDPALEAKLADTRIAQPLLFATQAALTDSFMRMGLTPSAVFGHSVGEIAAAYACGAVSLVDAVRIVVRRSHHHAGLAGQGRMAAVALDPDRAIVFAQSHGLQNLYVAASNTRNSITISGPGDEIAAFVAAATAARIPAQPLDIDYPFHHPLIDASREAFLTDLPEFPLHTAEPAFISTVTGAALDGKRLDAAYWWRNVREPVLFMEATETAIEQGCTLFLEIGPRPVLTSYLTKTLKQRSVAGVALPTLSRKEPGSAADPVARSFARAIAHGAAFDAERVLGTRNAFVRLPPLPFDSADLRNAPTSDAIDLYGRAGERHSTLAGWRIDGGGSAWKNHIDAHLFPDLAEHRIGRRSILPGSAFLEIMLSAAMQFHGTEHVEIGNMEILQPMVLTKNRLLEVSTVISKATGEMEIRSRERLSDDEWTLHAVARCRKALIENPVADANDRAFSRSMPASRLYETALRLGLDYGPRFRLLEEASSTEDGFIEVTLSHPEPPANPHITFNLNPMSVDATFHALIALFDHPASDGNPMPYIPVRFGKVKLRLAGAQICRATISMERLSANSIKAGIRLFAADGELAATLDDCRFKRTSLGHHHKPLAALSFHYRAVPGKHSHAPAALSVETPCFPVLDESEPDEATLLLTAAIYSACHAIAVKAGNGRYEIRPASLPGDFAFRSFLSSCLHNLVTAGLCTDLDGIWTLSPEYALPSPDEILRGVYSERPDRSAEIILINNAFHEAMAKLDRPVLQLHSHDLDEADAIGQDGGAFSPATLEHQRIHSASSAERTARILEAVKCALAKTGDSQRLRIVELCTSSRSTTQQLARIASRHGATLMVIEPCSRARCELEIAFETSPDVEIVETSTFDRADILVSASQDLFHWLENDVAAHNLLARSLGNGATFLACVDAPGPFSDFAMGQIEDWFSRSVDAQFPIGRLASVAEWEQAIASARPHSSRVVLHQRNYGPIISIEAHGPAENRIAPPRTENAAPSLLLHDGGLDRRAIEELTGIVGGVALSGNFKADRIAIGRAILSNRQADLIFLPGTFGARDGSEALQTNIVALSAIMEAMSTATEADDAASDRQKPSLGVLLPFGSPTATTAPSSASALQARNTGLWAFLRVLRNEFSTLDIHAIDFAGSTAVPDQVNAIRRVMDLASANRASANREWLVGPGHDEVSEIRAVPGPFDAAHLETGEFAVATLRQQIVSQPSSLIWEECEFPRPGPDEVVIEVAATGLNFRDVMWSMGLLPEEALEDGFTGATIGMECAGRIAATGSEVTLLRVGDPVMAIAPDAFSTHVKATQSSVAKLPESVSLKAGATLPVAFLTAYYAIVELARIRPHETILIHGSAGGVGLAALQIARARGAKVIATAGTLEKRRLLAMLGAEHVFDSRSLDFVGKVREVTGGSGVDVVLNSLHADAMERSLELLKPFGRFLELGKRDYFADTKIGLRPFRRNISYFGIDADQLLKNLPDLTVRLLHEIAELFSQGTLSPLPYRAFRFDEIHDAFRLMQGSGHIGKIVVTPPAGGRDSVMARRKRTVSASAEGTHLVVGGIGGFGLAAAEWLVEKGARRLALCSRRGIADDATTAAMEKWAARGVTATLHSCDVTKEEEVDALLQDLRAKAPIKSVVHAAMVLDDALLRNLDRDRNRPVIETKALGADILDRLTRNDPVEHFILFSSATTLVGNPGQSNYVAANGYLEGLARARREAGLPALAVAFGAISDTGFLARNSAVNEQLSKRLGRSALTARQALERLESYMAQEPGTVDAAVVAIAEIDWAGARALAGLKSPLYEVIRRASEHQPAGAESDEIDLATRVAGKSPQEGEQIIYDLLSGQIASILRIPAADISRSKSLKEIGLDSLMAMELGMGFHQKTGFDLPLASVTDATTIGDITQKLYLRIAKRDETDETNGQPDTTPAMIGQFAAAHTPSMQKSAQP